MISICFPSGPFARWSVTIAHARKMLDGTPRWFVTVSDPSYTLYGIMAVSPGEEAYDAVWSADRHGGGGEYLQAALDAVIEQGRSWLDERNERIPAELRPDWRGLVDAADHSRAEFFARYPDGTVPPFELVHTLYYDRVTGELVAA
jgi:hypothetical protein